MSRSVETLALYTTVYPGVEGFLPEWYRSVRLQSDQDFSLWIGVDALPVDAVREALGGDPGATWVVAEQGDTIAQVRQRALARVVQHCDAVVLVDSDDVLDATRVEGARAALRTGDLTACALRIVDAQGRDTGRTLGLPSGMQPGRVIPRWNVFGLSNSAFRSELLERCLPIPTTVDLVDWFLATRAWLLQARLTFDPVIRMDYRRHGSNMAQVGPPFDAAQVARETDLVLRHLRLVLGSDLAGADPLRSRALIDTASDVELFSRRIVQDPERLAYYVERVNEVQTEPLWWASVAHPRLRHLWINEEEGT